MRLRLPVCRLADLGDRVPMMRLASLPALGCGSGGGPGTLPAPAGGTGGTDAGAGGGNGGGSGSGDAGAFDAPPPSCTVTIEPNAAAPYYSGRGRAIQFDATVTPESAGPFSFAWQPSSGSIDANPGASAIVRTPTAGTYTVSVEVRSSHGPPPCTASATVTVLDGPSTLLRLRFTPGGLALPRQEVELSLVVDALQDRSFALQ